MSRFWETAGAAGGGEAADVGDNALFSSFASHVAAVLASAAARAAPAAPAAPAAAPADLFGTGVRCHHTTVPPTPGGVHTYPVRGGGGGVAGDERLHPRVQSHRSDLS